MKITARENGPYLLETGGRRVRIVRGDTEEIIEKPAVAFCRCGQSSNKPLCDGTHKAAEFGEPEATIELLD